MAVQRSFVIDQQHDVAKDFECNYNLSSWEPSYCVYQLKPKTDNLRYDEQSLIRYRRRGWMKNDLILTDE